MAWMYFHSQEFLNQACTGEWSYGTAIQATCHHIAHLLAHRAPFHGFIVALRGQGFA
jgi:hypothetical protein